MPLAHIVDALLKKQKIGKVAAIVLDDGYVNNYSYAYPIAKRNNVHINIAMVTGFASSYNQLSWNQIQIMEKYGFIHFLNHSWSHQSLHGTNTETILKQVTVAQEQLEKTPLKPP
ncbi:MAG: Polysaccharide deacetylase [Microgenomates bacterium OLB23]|nr:MAG: Polysaccharide deacetylase [Microgenomates bacterium OLB23]